MDRIILSGIPFTRHHIGASAPSLVTNPQWGSDSDSYSERTIATSIPRMCSAKPGLAPVCTSTVVRCSRARDNFAAVNTAVFYQDCGRKLCRGTLLESPRRLCRDKYCRISIRPMGEVVTTNELQVEIDEKEVKETEIPFCSTYASQQRLALSGGFYSAVYFGTRTTEAHGSILG
jgi:hypothetical protein